MESVTNFFWNEPTKTGEPSGSSSKRASMGSDPISKGSPSANRKSSYGELPGSTGNAAGSSSNALSGAGLQKAMTDTLIEKIIKMALYPSSEMAVDDIENRMAAAKDRPKLSVQIMSRNFILMNSRLSLPFTLINEIIKIFNWTNPAYTISVIFFYTYIILKPMPTMTSIPIFYLLFGVMVPEYLYIHSPNYSPYLDTNPVPAEGPPLRKAEVPKPVPELSQEFVLNLTDLQNHLLIYVKTYDFIHSVLIKFAFFVNEKISAFMFTLLLIIAFVNFLFMDSIIEYVPLKAILVILGWSFFIIMHPKNREELFSRIYSEETRLKLLTLTNKCENIIKKQVKYMEDREHRVVAVYEIQKFKRYEKGWITIGYSNDDYTLFSNLRISEQKIEENCVTSIEEVKPPVSWEWLDNITWALDLDPTEWLERGFIEYIDVDQDTKWVYDLNVDGTKGNYRRRMWTNVCVRKIDFEAVDDGEKTPAEKASDPIKGGAVHRVTRGSLSGTSQTEEDARPIVKKTGSATSVTTNTSSLSSPRVVKADSSKAVNSLVDALNSTL